jgi:integrase
LTFLGQILPYAGARGLENLDKIDLSKLRAKSGKDTVIGMKGSSCLSIAIWPSTARLRFKQMRELEHPWRAGIEGAQQIFHCALYFVPILIYYTGCRHEELCGAMVDDVIFDNGEIPYLHIAKNERRRIKNAQSQRDVPLHPEVLRLNFLGLCEGDKGARVQIAISRFFRRPVARLSATASTSNSSPS